jgi:hypothetical protein
LENLVKYLLAPLQTGVYYGQFMIDFSTLEQFFREVATKVAKEHEADSRDLIKAAEKIKRGGTFTLEELKKHFDLATLHLLGSEECSKEILEYISGREEIGRVALYERLMFWRDLPPGRLRFLESRFFHDIVDVAVVDVGKKEDEKIILEVATTKNGGMSRFHNFIKSIPHIGNTIEEIRKRKTHSSRYTFRPYPLAVSLWLGHEKSAAVPGDLKDFLRGAVRYYAEEEWRTAIVLSAIAVESILADLYEEQYKKYAPNVPLGELFHKVKNKIEFSSDIIGAIEKVNGARISAVHRSRFPVSDREASNALHGATIFIMWYSSNF